MVLATIMRRALRDVSTARFQLKVWWVSVWWVVVQRFLVAAADLALVAADCWRC